MISLGNLFKYLTMLTMKSYFLLPNQYFPSFNFCLLSPALLLCTFEKSLAPTLLYPPISSHTQH